ncbi:MAG: hypothetical protein HZB65_04120 [Candidatus Aenigmarchaeota archaeon]|nr:hypothetical protein [Candidatus Aenigmarchaeota archaeon]
MIGIPVINSARSLIIAQDKFRTYSLMQQNNIQTPFSILCYDIRRVWNLIESGCIRYPFVVKKPYGGRGEGVFVIMNAHDLGKASVVFSVTESVLVQDYIELEKHNGCFRDMRIWVCRNPDSEKPRFVGAFYRNAPIDRYLTNTSIGGSIAPMKVCDDEIIKISEKALDIIGADVAGIDIARDSNGSLYLLEINASFDTAQESINAIGVDVWNIVMDLVEKRVNRKKWSQ